MGFFDWLHSILYSECSKKKNDNRKKISELDKVIKEYESLISSYKLECEEHKRNAEDTLEERKFIEKSLSRKNAELSEEKKHFYNASVKLAETNSTLKSTITDLEFAIKQQTSEASSKNLLLSNYEQKIQNLMESLREEKNKIQNISEAASKTKELESIISRIRNENLNEIKQKLETTKQARFYLGIDGVVKHANKQAVELFGNDMVNLKYDSVMSCHVFEGLAAIYEQNLNPPYALELKTKDGEKAYKVEIELCKDVLNEGFDIMVRKPGWIFSVKIDEDYGVKMPEVITQKFLNKRFADEIVKFLISKEQYMEIDFSNTSYDEKRDDDVFERFFELCKGLNTSQQRLPQKLQKSFMITNANEDVSAKINQYPLLRKNVYSREEKDVRQETRTDGI